MVRTTKGIQMKTNSNAIRFFYNGLKVGNGKLQRAWFSFGNYTDGTTGVTIYGRGYQGFSADVAAAFKVQNDSDSQSDYFVEDQIRVMPDHPRFADAVAMVIKRLEKDIVRCDKKGATRCADDYRSDLQLVQAATVAA